MLYGWGEGIHSAVSSKWYDVHDERSALCLKVNPALIFHHDRNKRLDTVHDEPQGRINQHPRNDSPTSGKYTCVSYTVV